tara:strand:+ start:1759 stop:4551 length:2793 start_codon:yes stop_codon:yes gene_type:complete
MTGLKNETGSFLMHLSTLFKILTCILVAFGSFFPAHSVILNQQTFKTHLRWSLDADKQRLSINKDGQYLNLKTLDQKLFLTLVEDFTKLDGDKRYFSGFNYKEGKNGSPSEITVGLKDESIELFTFYKDKENKHVLDFWINEDLVATKKAAVRKKPAVVKVAPKPVLKKKAPKKAPVKLDKEISVLNPEKIAKSKVRKEFRDFRYGAAFVWDYPAFIPPLESEVNLAVKGPDYFYEIKDRPFQNGDKKEAHMQLSINFYRKQKWGLMTKSINLYEKQYGKDSNRDLLEFMKAVSLIKNIIKPSVETKIEQPAPITNDEGEIVESGPQISTSNKGIFSAALAKLQNVADRSQNYELKKASMRYILESNLREQDYIQSLQVAKELYVAATTEFDDDMIVRSSRVILYSLAKLKQLSKMEEFLKNKAVIRVLPPQEGDAYIGYVNLINGKLDQVIASYRANEKSYAKPVHPAILFNTAEAMFRKAQYNKAVKVFDEFVANYSFYDIAGFANVRVALGYDLLGKDEKKVLKLYESAINKSASAKARFEAKLRYVGLRVARKYAPTDKDLETVSFLEASPIEKKEMGTDLKRLLWLTRLRSLLAQSKYEDALAYLSSVPMETLSQGDKRTFNGDGAETILGIIKTAYLNEDYPRAVKVWEVFKDQYESKVAKNPYTNFIVSDSFLKLGLVKSFERAFSGLENLDNKATRAFPKWVEAHKDINVKDYLNELKLTKLLQEKNWKQADKLLGTLKNEKNINYNFYKGIVAYHLKNYNESVRFFEKLLVKPNLKNILSPRQSFKMLTTYSESLYQGNDQKRFRTNVAALINDLRRSGNKNTQQALERLEYLFIESLNGEKNVNYDLISLKSKEFLGEHKGSIYKDRVKYLRGVSLVNTSQEDEGKKVLEELVEGEKTPGYLKGLARTELSSLVLRNKTL